VTPRARPMAPEDRRQAILAALIPLLVERGGDVTTKEIAQAAGIAEGTIFGVFADKRSLFLAAAEEAMNPVGGQQAFDAALAGVTDLREGVIVVTDRVLERMRLTMSVMMAVRPHLIAAFQEEKAAGGKPEMGPPAFVLKAQNDLHARLTRLFEPHADDLRVDPGTAAVALRSLIFGAHRPELGMSPALTADQIADLLLGGVLARKEH
jgi:AcrR family transcriptional regulator